MAQGKFGREEKKSRRRLVNNGMGVHDRRAYRNSHDKAETLTNERHFFVCFSDNCFFPQLIVQNNDRLSKRHRKNRIRILIKLRKGKGEFESVLM